MRTLVKNNIFRTIINVVLLSFGAVLAACALETFLIPNTILDGGVTGISIIINKISQNTIPLGLLVVRLNIPFI